MKTQEEQLNNRLIDAITLDKDGNPKFYWHQDQLANLRALIQSELAKQESQHKGDLTKAKADTIKDIMASASYDPSTDTYTLRSHGFSRRLSSLTQTKEQSNV